MVDYVDPVLVVDDLNTMTRIVDGMLRKCGFVNVDQVHDGPTALQKLREKSYLFVVTDREMPGMNGLELAREIRADPKIRNVPLVIMSASSEPQHAEAAIAAGANFFMTKPFNLTTLKDVITQLMRPPRAERKQAVRTGRLCAPEQFLDSAPLQDARICLTGRVWGVEHAKGSFHRAWGRGVRFVLASIAKQVRRPRFRGVYCSVHRPAGLVHGTYWRSSCQSRSP